MSHFKSREASEAVEFGVQVVDSDRHSTMNTDALGLLRAYNAVEVRDIHLDVSNNVAKLYDKFAQVLREQYGEILEVTGSVAKLYDCLKNGDFELRDLCFKDELYKLKKLEPLEEKIEKEADKKVDEGCGDDNIAAKKVLIVSNWSLAISDFVSRFALSSSSGKLFDQVIRQFQKLNETDNWKEYETVISDRCGNFIQYLISSPANNVTFTVEQWARIWSLVFKNYRQLSWNQEQLLQLDKILFESVLEQPLDMLMKNSDDQVTNFVHSPEFEKKLNNKIIGDIEHQFQLLEELISQEYQDTTPTFEYSHVLQELNIAQVVDNSRLHSMGLTTKFRVQVYNLVDPLIQMVDDLQTHGGQPNQVKEFRNRATALLQDKTHLLKNRRFEEDEKQEQTSESSKTMDKLVSGIMFRQDDLNVSQLIDRQIDILRV